MLSEHDEEVIAALERQLTQSDPRFVARMRSLRQVEVSVPALALAGGWVATLLLTAAFGWIAVGVMLGVMVVLDLGRRILRWRLSRR